MAAVLTESGILPRAVPGAAPAAPGVFHTGGIQVHVFF
ncbi:hypothetical protein KPATCC21470_5975 [Kitasatospora purpeofusca]